MTARETPAGEEWRGKVGKLNEEELDEFLAGGNVARLACLDACGLAVRCTDLVPVRRRGFYIIPRARSAWAKYMADDGRVSLSIDSQTPVRQGPAQGGQADRGAECRRPVGRDCQRDVAALSRRERPEVSRAHAQ